MNSIKRLFVLFCLISFVEIGYSQLSSDFAQSKLSEMTLDQKISQLNALDGRRDFNELKKLVRDEKVGILMNVTDPIIVNELQSIACNETKSKIPLLFSRDVIHGFKTILPIPLGQAASFNIDLVRAGARNAAVEATEHGVKWAFAPMIDVSRDPRWGRVAESFGEDTYLVAKMGTAVVEGYQNSKLSETTSMAACVKHFIGYGAVEGGKDYNTTFIPERQLREVYLPPFAESINVGCAGLMTSFNSNNGMLNTNNRYLLKDVLRKELKFDGVIISDWGSIAELIYNGVAENRKSAGKMAITAGMEVDMSSNIYLHNLKELVEKKEISESLIDSAVYRVLKLKAELNLFEKPYTTINDAKRTYSKEHLDVAYKLAKESIVLLKNDGVLPISSKVKNILVVGPLADAPHDQLGTWSLDGESGKTQTPWKSLSELYGDKINIQFVKGLNYSRDLDTISFPTIRQKAKKADVIIAFVGEEAVLSGEAHSLANLDFQGAQKELIKVLNQLKKPLITVVLAGRPLIIEEELNRSNALLYAWHPGTMGGPAIADILFGKSYPVGKLPITFPKSVGQIPIYYNHYRVGRPAISEKIKPIQEIPVNSHQSILGHFSYYLDIGSEPLFPFGYGLTYSTFKIEELKILKDTLKVGENLTVFVKVKNTGNREAAETIQLYVSDLFASIVRPNKELKNFKRVCLKPDESKEILLEIPVSSLTLINTQNEKVVEKGKFKISAGFDSQDLVSKFFVVD